MTAILLSLLQKVHSHEKRYHDLQSDILPDFPINLNCHLTLRRILAQEMFGLAPAGLGGGDGSRGESFGFLFPRGICFPPKERLLRRPHTLWRPKPGISCFGPRGVICGLVEVVAVGWCKIFVTSSRAIRVQTRQGQTSKCIAASQIQFRKVLSMSN